MSSKTATRKITNKGQVTLPQEIRELLGSRLVRFKINSKGNVEIIPAESKIQEDFGSVPVPSHIKNKTEQEI